MLVSNWIVADPVVPVIIAANFIVANLIVANSPVANVFVICVFPLHPHFSAISISANLRKWCSLLFLEVEAVTLPLTKKCENLPIFFIKIQFGITLEKFLKNRIPTKTSTDNLKLKNQTEF